MTNNNLMYALETLAFEALAISELVNLISDFEKEGCNAIDNYSNAIWYVAKCSRQNAKALDKIVKSLQAAAKAAQTL